MPIAMMSIAAAPILAGSFVRMRDREVFPSTAALRATGDSSGEKHLSRIYGILKLRLRSQPLVHGDRRR